MGWFGIFKTEDLVGGLPENDEVEHKSQKDLGREIEADMLEIEKGHLSQQVIDKMVVMVSNSSGPTRELLQKVLDKMLYRRTELEEMNKKEEQDTKTPEDLKNANGLGEERVITLKEAALILLNEIAKNSGILGAGDVVKFSQEGVEDAMLNVFSMINKFQQFGFKVETQEHEIANSNDQGSTKSLAYAIHFPQGFEVTNLADLTSDDLMRAMTMNKEQPEISTKQPNVFVQVVGSHQEQDLQKVFESFAAKVGKELQHGMSEIFQEVRENSSGLRDIVQDGSDKIGDLAGSFAARFGTRSAASASNSR